MRDFEALVGRRDTPIDGFGPWYWLMADNGAWDGPKTDWEDHHRHKWLSRVTDWEICIQAGGCLGMYPRLLSRHFRDVYTFEADALNFYVLNLNCQSDNIHKFNAALGAGPGMIGVNRSSRDNVGMNRVEGEGRVPIMTIDSLELPKCGLIALDIEGYEIHALKGAVETIKRCSPVITCENANDEIKQLLTPLGYTAVDQSISDTVFAK